MDKPFSQRIGAAEGRQALQVDGMDPPLWASLWNGLTELFGRYDSPVGWRAAAQAIARDVFKIPVDDVPDADYECRDWLKGRFISELKWYEVYDVVEYSAQRFDASERERRLRAGGGRLRDCYSGFNRVLEREMSGYRFVSGMLTRITDPVETAEVQEASAKSRAAGLVGASDHIRTAVRHLGARPTPDYRNAMKEAISAVESVSCQVEGCKPGDFAGTLRRLGERTKVHGALRAAFEKLYGYTSDEGGVRHAIVDDPNVGFEEAKFMVVACSAFVNYVIGKASIAGLLRRT